MTRDDIIRMAQEAGFLGIVVVQNGFSGPSKAEVFSADGNASLTKFAELVAAAEREKCAAIVEKQAIGMMRVDAPLYGAAEEIRKRHD